MAVNEPANERTQQFAAVRDARKILDGPRWVRKSPMAPPPQPLADRRRKTS